LLPALHGLTVAAVAQKPVVLSSNYWLIHLAPTRVALSALASPVMALIVGHLNSHEPLTMKVTTGTLLILAVLLMHEFGERVVVFKKAW